MDKASTGEIPGVTNKDLQLSMYQVTLIRCGLLKIKPEGMQDVIHALARDLEQAEKDKKALSDLVYKKEKELPSSGTKYKELYLLAVAMLEAQVGNPEFTEAFDAFRVWKEQNPLE